MTLDQKLNLTKAEAMAFLGVKRRFFDEQIATRCKGTKAGTCVVYDRLEIVAAWNSYKIDAGSERPAEKGVNIWDAQKHPGSTGTKRVMTLTRSTNVSDFDAAASTVLSKRKLG